MKQYTLEEIKNLVNPKETEDWIEILKQLILLKVGEKKVIHFNDKDWPVLFKWGAPYLELQSLVVINGKLLVCVHYDEETFFGTACIGKRFGYSDEESAIQMPINTIKTTCELIFDGKYIVPFDFETMSITTNNENGRYKWYNNCFKEYIGKHKKELDSFINGEANGHFQVGR